MNCENLGNPSMDKKQQLKHTGNKPKEQSAMEKKKNDKSKSIHDILPLELIHRILLRAPIRHLARLRCVSKMWCSLISDRDFAEFHFHHSPAATNACFFIENPTMAYLVYLDDNYASQKEVRPPFKKKPPYDFAVLGSCRGFILLDRHPHFLMDDYLLLVAWSDCGGRYHLDCFSLRTNSWINLDVALPKPLGVFDSFSCGLFLNGAIHWLPFSLTADRDAILIFDVKERTFSRISGPKQPVMSACSYPRLALLGGCLALYYSNKDNCNTNIWVMKEYKVHSSWTLYQIPYKFFRPLCLSSNGDIIGRGYTSDYKVGYFIYNVREDLLKHFKNLRCPLPIHQADTMYTESLLPLLSDIKDKDNKKKEENCM
ncbi:F-box protein [Arachis hypogaea]|nr:F-box protein [Arachis hypogaea]